MQIDASRGENRSHRGEKRDLFVVMDEMYSASTILMLFSAGSLGIEKQLPPGGVFISSTSHHHVPRISVQ